eukprot:3064417-Lingulodinium_polyedra.AAC.1
MARGDDDEGEPQGPEARPAQPFVGDWCVGSPEFVLRPELMQTPAFTSAFAADVDAWSSSLQAVVHHVPGALPYRSTQYDRPCPVGTCRCNPAVADATQMLTTFYKLFPRLHACQVFLVLTDVGEPLPFAVAYVQKRPKLSVFLPLRP